MCGIFCVFASDSDETRFTDLHDTYESCCDRLLRRGPDAQNVSYVAVNDHALILAASVLWLRGTRITPQPFESDNGNILCYNGDLFGGAAVPREVVERHGDTRWLCEDLLDVSEDDQRLADTLEDDVHGPFSFVYFDRHHSRLLFCRDHYGRRSLLIGRSKDKVVVCSVAKKNLLEEFECQELPVLGLYIYEFKTRRFILHAFKKRHGNFNEKLIELEKVTKTKIEVMGEVILEKVPFVEPSQTQLSFIQNILTTADSDYQYKFFFNKLINDPNWFGRINKLETLLKHAVASRLAIQTNFCNNCKATPITCTNHSTVGVLFSGGVDCAILALLADLFVHKDRSIDLINVSFSSKAPDLFTGLTTLLQLQKLRPNRSWNFVKIDVSQEQLNFNRNKYIADLIFPLKTILDDSLGCALWFASRGKTGSYTSPCRVLLVGMGADELFGGYTKQRTALRREGWSGLNKSLENDWQNISFRNLGRDDRVVSDHGRQLRTPYLDEEVVKFVQSLNCWEKTFPIEDLPQGIGEKILLRALAYNLGLKETAIFKKKALQFGCKIAHSKENANNVSPRL